MVESKINDNNNVQKRKNDEENNNKEQIENKKLKTEESLNKEVDDKKKENSNNEKDGSERDKRPFENLEISDYEPLFNSKRELCQKCNKTFKNYCYNCLKVFDSVKQYIPQVKLPLPLDM